MDLSFQKAKMEMVFPIMITRNSTAKTAIQRNNSAFLHIVDVLVLPERDRECKVQTSYIQFYQFLDLTYR